MVMLVTLEEAKRHLQQDIDATDDDIALKVHAASAAVLAYLKDYDFIDSSGDVDYVAVPYQVRAATLLLVGILFRDRDGQDAGIWQPGYLPAPVTALLYPLRTPSLA